MKVICNRGALLEALTLTGHVVPTRSTLPVLSCVKVTAADDKLTIAATDGEAFIRYTDNQVQVDQAGEALLPADKFRDIVRESVDDTLSIEVTSNESGAGTAVIRGQDSLFKVFTQRAADFPPVPDFEGAADFTIPGGLLKRLISQTIFAIAKEGERFVFRGVLFVAQGKKLDLISTDGRRLAQAKGDLATDAAVKKEASRPIVPAKALSLMEKLASDPEELVEFQLRENQVVFHTASATLTSNLVEGQFPPYEDVIPKDCDKKMTAGTADFLGAVRRAALLTAEESRGVRFSFSKKGLVLQSRSPEAGEATVNFPCKYEGADVEIGFNHTFLTDALKVVDSDEITLELTAPNRSGLLRGGPNFLYVIMPVNLQ